MSVDVRDEREIKQVQGADVWRLRRAAPQDLREIAELAREVLCDAWTLVGFEEHLRAARSDLWWVCGSDGRAAGYLAARYLAGEGEIFSIGVRASLRRQGLASRLLKALETSQEWRGVARIHLEVRESNQAAQAFYARQGFVRVGKRPRYYPDGEMAILMTRDRVDSQTSMRDAESRACGVSAQAVAGAEGTLPIRAQAEVVVNRPEATAQYRLRLRVANWPSVAPGQFVMLTPKAGAARACSDPLLPRPMAIYRVFEGETSSEIEILYRVVGRGTGLLSEVSPGDQVGLVGPLGRGFPAPQAGEHSILVGGGSGIASLYLFARAACERVRQEGAGRVSILLGARTVADLPAQSDFADLGAELILATEDGSVGERGFVTEPLRVLLEGSAASTSGVVLYVCGPTPMMRACANLAAKCERQCFVSLENPMACGFGVCLGCATTLQGGGKALVCKDGPVFAADRIDWENVGG